MSSLHVPAWAWALLAGLMFVLITIDLLAHRGEHEDSRKRAIAWSIAWIAVALVFNGFVAVWFGLRAGEEFLAAYLLEKSLSVDNLFVFLLIFGSLGIPRKEQRRVLTWGILGALLTRGAFIAVGTAAIQRWHTVTYLFGAILLFTAFKMLRSGEEEEEAKLLVWLEKRLPWTRKLDGHKFFTRQNGKLLATPLLVALVAIEMTDVVFAVDSVPAAFAVSSEPFIVYSSNVLAVLGLRALYIVLAGALADLRYLRFGLAAVLGLAGAKMLAVKWVKVPPLLSVGLIVLCIGGAVVASVIANRRDGARAEADVGTKPAEQS
jgi:tellurite resistance protein TerC